MSKNIIIQEGGTDYQFTAKKLKTNKVGGGTCLWVPEDEVNLKTKRITKNGKYLASTDEAYGFKSVKVNVKGGKGSANSNGTPKVTYDSDGDEENAPGGIGCSVIGKDTSGIISGTPGGDDNEYAVGIDSSGNIVATKVPSGIEIGKVPDKTSYTDGETIDYSGIIVILKGGDGAMFSNSDYPNGRVPFAELVFPMSKAEAHGTSDLLEACIRVTENSWTYFRKNYDNPSIPPTSVYEFMVDTSGCYACINQSNNGYGLAVFSLLPFHWSFRGVNEGQVVVPGNTYSPIYDQSIGLYKLIDITDGDRDNFSDAIPTINVQEYIPNLQSIPVRWTSPYDGRTFEDTFEITVTGNSGSGSTDGGGYSDDSGGSSSGGGTSIDPGGSGYSDDSGGSSSGGGTSF